jgi:hypothetical protein
MTNEELNEKFAALAVAQAKTEYEIDKFIAGLAVSQAETDVKFMEAAESLKKVGTLLGNIADNNGSNAEDYFFNSLEDKPELGGVRYDTIVKNFFPKSKRGLGEFDIVMVNGESIALIECKYKAHLSDVEKLITKQVDSFKKLFPVYANFKFYLGIASFSFYPELEKFTKQNGVAILKQKGDVVEIEAENLKAY